MGAQIDGLVNLAAMVARGAVFGDRSQTDAHGVAGARRDLERSYPAADAFVLPTYYETFALVCMEAMAAGLPSSTRKSSPP